MRRRGRGFWHGTYLSSKTGREETYESSYELRRFRALDASPLVLAWTKDHHRIRVAYRLFGKGHHYIPDILVEFSDGGRALEEVKGHIFGKAKFLKKRSAARAFCALRGWEYRVIFRGGLDRVEGIPPARRTAI